MASAAKRVTIYLNPNLYKALRLKALETSRSVSELVNEAVREPFAGDAEDLAAFRERAGEPLISYDEMVKRLKMDRSILLMDFPKKVDLTQDPIVNVVHHGIKRGIRIALQNECYGAAVILICSGIDAMSFLDMPARQEDVTKK